MGAPPAPGGSLTRIDPGKGPRPPPAVANLGSRHPSLLHLLVAAAAAESRLPAVAAGAPGVSRSPGPAKDPALSSGGATALQGQDQRVISNAATTEVRPYGARATRKEGRLGGGYRVCCSRRHLGVGWSL